MNKYRQEAMMNLAYAINAIQDGGLNTIRTVQALAKAAKSLHKRYENECSYEWADTDRYRKRTENLERHIAELFAGLKLPSDCTMEIQGDPRGWPLIFTLQTSHGPREHRLG